MGPEQEGLIEIILWSNPDQVMVEEDHFMVELTSASALNESNCK
jgi:hypothetical protein